MYSVNVMHKFNKQSVHILNALLNTYKHVYIKVHISVRICRCVFKEIMAAGCLLLRNISCVSEELLFFCLLCFFTLRPSKVTFKFILFDMDITV